MDLKHLRTAMDAVASRVDETLSQTGDAFPYVANEDGEWQTTADGNWCGGHWIDLLRIAGQHTDGEQKRFETAADKHTETLRAKMPRENMFFGMNCDYAGFRGYDTTGDYSLFALGLEGASAMTDHFHQRSRMIPIGEYQVEGPSSQFDLRKEGHGRPPGSQVSAVDAIHTALPVLWRAYRETGTARFRDTALAHADRHLDRCIRTDGSTWHECSFDPETGDLRRQFNDLAVSDDTCWSRGQGWNVSGLSRAYNETGAERYLWGLERTVAYHRRNAPDDGVPYWDYETSDIPETPRDTSAAALFAYGLTRLTDVGGHPDRISDLRAVGESVLETLIADYLVTDTDDAQYGAVRHGCFNFPGEYAIDNELVWTDYYVARTIHERLELTE